MKELCRKVEYHGNWITMHDNDNTVKNHHDTHCNVSLRKNQHKVESSLLQINQYANFINHLLYLKKYSSSIVKFLLLLQSYLVNTCLANMQDVALPSTWKSNVWLMCYWLGDKMLKFHHSYTKKHDMAVCFPPVHLQFWRPLSQNLAFWWMVFSQPEIYQFLAGSKGKKCCETIPESALNLTSFN